jgi:mitosis inhibitor protein kinase SWE1
MVVDGGVRPRGLEVGKLDDLVKWMLSPNPVDRPTCRQILASEEVKWVDSRRRAGAVIFEGEFGPDDDGHVEEKELEDEDWQMEL